MTIICGRPITVIGTVPSKFVQANRFTTLGHPARKKICICGIFNNLHLELSPCQFCCNSGRIALSCIAGPNRVDEGDAREAIHDPHQWNWQSHRLYHQ